MMSSKWVAFAVAAALGPILAAPVHGVPPPRPAVFADFDGDGRGDLSVWDPARGIWRFAAMCELDPDQSCGFSHGHLTGSAPGASAVPGDYDGDGLADPAVFDPWTGQWSIVPLRGAPSRTVWLGGPGDVPVPADYDGDGTIDPAVWRASEAQWRWTGRAPEWFGTAGDVPVPADYDGDGRADVAVWRPGDGTWYVSGSAGGYRFIPFGMSGDVPVPGDYDGDGRADAAVFRPSTGQWWVLRSGDGVHYALSWGKADDLLVPADYDGDGCVDVAVYRHGMWWIAGQVEPVAFGGQDETPVTAVRR